MSKKFFAGVLALALAAFVATAANAAYTHTTTLKVGSKGAQVMALQQSLNMTACKVGSGLATGTFGQLTKAAVMCFQAQNGLKADGVVGPMTGMKIGAIIANGNGGSNSNGCQSGWAFNPANGQPCNGGSTPSTPSTGSLSGGAGDITVTTTSTGVDSTVNEGDSNVKVLGFKVKATGSDVAVSAVKLTFENNGSGSDRLEKYVDSVAVYMDDSKVGNLDVSDFSRESGSPDTYTGTVLLSNAVVRQDKTITFYVAVSGVDTIDTTNLNASWDVTVNTVRFTDATGAILSDSPSSITDTFGVDSASANDDISVTASTNNPVATSFTVKEDTTSDSDLVLAFKLKTGSDSGDIQINEIPVAITIANGGSNADSADAVIDSVQLKIGSQTYDSDSDTGTVTNGAGTQTYTFSFDDNQVVVSGDSSTEVKVYVKFNDQKSGTVNNYDNGTTLYAVVNGSAIDAESANGDSITVSGSSTGKTHSLAVNAPTVALVSTPTLASFVQSDTAADTYLAKFTFNVTAGDDDIYIPVSAASAITKSVTGGATVTSSVLDAEDTSLDDNTSGNNTFLITAGSTEKFTYSVYLTGNDASGKVAITAIKYDTTDTTSPSQSVTTGLSTFATPTVYLAQ